MIKLIRVVISLFLSPKSITNIAINVIRLNRIVTKAIMDVFKLFSIPFSLSIVLNPYKIKYNQNKYPPTEPKIMNVNPIEISLSGTSNPQATKSKIEIKLIAKYKRSSFPGFICSIFFILNYW